MGKKKKKNKQKKGGKKGGAPAKNFVDNDETLDDYFMEGETHAQRTKKAKKLTGFEDDEFTQIKRKAVAQMADSESESEEFVQTGGKMSAAQRKKIKKMQQKQKAKEAAERKAREAAEKKAEAERLERMKYRPKRQTKDVKKYDSQGSYYTEESYYEGTTDSEGIKRTYKKTKRDVRKVDSEGSFYTEEEYYETDEEIEAAPKKAASPKKKSPPKKKGKRVIKKREVTKYDSEGSYITDEEYSTYEYSESESEEPVVKKKRVRNRKKPAVNKKDPAKKARPTMSDDSDSDGYVAPKRESPKAKQPASRFAGFDMSESESEEIIEEKPEPSPEPREPTPEPVKKQPAWKNKKKNKKGGNKKKIDDEFDLDWLNDDSPAKKKGGKKNKKKGGNKKQNNKKENETEDLSWIDDGSPKKKEQPQSPTTESPGGEQKLTKAQLKRQRKKERLKKEAEEKNKNAAQPSDKPERKLTEKQRLRLEKAKRLEKERRIKKEEDERLAEETRIREEKERLEYEKVEGERQAEKDRIRAEKNARRKERKKANKGRGPKKAPPMSAAAAEKLAMRKKIQEEKRLAKLEQKRKQKEKSKKEREERERKQKEEEEARIQKEEEEERKIIEEEKKKAEAERFAEEEEERSKRITEEVRRKAQKKANASAKNDSDESEDNWDDDESDDWDGDKETEEWGGQNTTVDKFVALEEEEEELEEGDEGEEWEDSTDNEEEPEPEKPKPGSNEWSDSEDEEPEPVVDVKPVAKHGVQKPVAEPVEEEEKPKPKKKKTWTCAACMQENKKKERKCTSCGSKKPKKVVDLTNLRAPIGVIMGNVDSGKTSLLDYIRSTKVQSGEAGGITQQIGATNLPMDLIKEQCGEELINQFLKDIHLPGLLIIDTPGHAAFGNMRERGSTMCDIAIVVINMFDGIIGTAEACIKMLMDNEAPFIVAFNQIDKLYEWEPHPGLSVKESLELQNLTARNDFIRNYNKTRLDFANLGLNADLFWESEDVAKGKMKKENIILVPTSARTGCGIPDMLLMWIKQCQTRKMAKKLKLTPNLNCTILEVKKVHGQGYCLDVLISDGCLLAGQTIAVCSLRDHGIITRIKQIQTPDKIQDLRVERAKYNNVPKCEASMGCRIVCDQHMEHSVAGSRIMLIQNPKDSHEVEDARDEVQAGLSALKNMEKTDVGVMVVASTLGSLEALTKFLKEKANVPMCGWSLGTVHKKEVIRASVMLEHKPEYAVILAFDVDISPDARQYAENEGVEIFQEEIIYQLEQRFLDHLELAKERARESVKGDVVFPVVMSIIEDKIFNRKNPIVMGCHIDKCDLRIGTPLCAIVKDKGPIKLGVVESIEVDSKEVEIGLNDTDVCVKIGMSPDMATIIEFKRHFDADCQIVSMISRRSLDAIKKHYGRDLKREQLLLLRSLKKAFDLD